MIIPLRHKNLSIDEMVVAWCCVCCHIQRSLFVGFLLLQYPVVCAVESLSLIYLLFVSWFIWTRRWFIDTLEIFHANQTSMCLNHIRIKGRLVLWNYCHVCFFSIGVTCWERADLLALLFVIFSCVLSLFHTLSWVRCKTWLYRFLIFAFFLTFKIACVYCIG